MAAGGRGAAGAARSGGPAGGAGRGGRPRSAGPGATKGHQVFKFGPDGKLLLTLGKRAVPADECCYQPNDVITAPNGDIFVAQIHGAGGGVIYKFDKTGKFLMKWGKRLAARAGARRAEPAALARDGLERTTHRRHP